MLALGAAALILSQTAGAQNAARGRHRERRSGTPRCRRIKRFMRKAIHAGATPGSVRRLGRVGGTGIPGKGAFEYPAMRANDPREGIDPDERSVARPLPYTAEGERALLVNKPAAGVRASGPGVSNDPATTCEPVGFPRMLLYELRTFQIVQTPTQMIFLNQTNNSWRSRGPTTELPASPKRNGTDTSRYKVATDSWRQLDEMFRRTDEGRYAETATSWPGCSPPASRPIPATWPRRPSGSAWSTAPGSPRRSRPT